MNWTESPKHEYFNSITPSHKHRKRSSVVVEMSDCLANDLDSIPGAVSKLLVNMFCLIHLIRPGL